MKSSTTFLAAVLLVAGCTSVPIGPSIMALPGTGKNFEQFRSDDAQCRQYAQYQIGSTSADQAGIDAGVRSAAVGTLVGAVAGAAIGGHDSAGVGAGTGLLVGSMAGTGAAQSSAYASQRSYDHAYIQCMYSKGEQVPVSASMMRNLNQAPVDQANAASAGASYPPPQPQGYAPSTR